MSHYIYVTTTLTIAKQSFHTTLPVRLMIARVLTSQKWSSGQTFNNALNLHCDFDLEQQSNPFTIHFGLLRAISLSLVAKRTNISKDEIESHISITWALIVTLTMKIATKFFSMTLFVTLAYNDVSTLVWLIYCCFTSTEARWFIWDGAPLEPS